MKGKKACRRILGGYLNDMSDELNRLKEAGLETNAAELNGKVHEFQHITMPGGIEFDLTKSTVSVRRAGAVLAMVLYAVEDNVAVPTVIVDEFFDHISDRGQRFFLAHEAGHLRHGDIGTPEDAVASLSTGSTIEGSVIRNRNIEQEFLADQYAAKMVGKREAILAMKEFRRLAAKNKWIGTDMDEINERIRHLVMTARDAS